MEREGEIFKFAAELDREHLFGNQPARSSTNECSSCIGAGQNEGANEYVIAVRGSGQCKVRVSFRNGAPDFVDEVSVGECTGGACCAACGPLPDHVVVVGAKDGG